MQEDYIANIKLLSSEQLDKLKTDISLIPANYNMFKKAHEYSEYLRDIARDPIIMSYVESVLGKNITLWGCKIIRLEPGRGHNWHIDVEHGSTKGVSLSLAVENFNKDTTFSLITNTENITYSPQEFFSENNNVSLLEKAKEFNPECDIRNIILNNGEFVMFKGRVWHSTANRSNQVRTSIVFQYCSTEKKPMLPITFTYPNILWSTTKPYYFNIE